jgi:hypothetical protein
VLEDDMKAALAGGERSVMAILAATHAGVTTEEFSAAVTTWLKTARHPRFKRPYTQLVYQPMLELLSYLRERVQDLRRLGRRRGVHARVCRAGVWHPARTDHREPHQDAVCDA